MPFYPESVTFLRACDSRSSGGNWLSTDHADFLTSSRLLRPPLIIIIFLVPFFGCLAVRLTICSRGAVFAVPLARRIDNILLAADGTVVDAAQWPIHTVFPVSCGCLFLAHCTATGAVPGARATVKGHAALAASPGPDGSRPLCRKALRTYTLLNFSGGEKLPAFYARLEPHTLAPRIQPDGLCQ